METELDGRLLAMRQTVALALALSTRSNPQAIDLALDILGDLRANVDSAPADSPFDVPAWATGAQDELDQIAHLVRAFTQQSDNESNE
ncbi:hypothetical protein [Bordetella muralis]|jgi:hypothetical protein|uniref:hypothetical protein n=1 Tax=Bordetella muralis TaxID=1649130 RepID=UPI0039EF8348